MRSCWLLPVKYVIVKGDFMKKYLLALCIVILLVIPDQLTKYLAVTHLKDTEGITLIDGVLRLYYLENRGSAFSLFQNQRTWFIIFTIIVLIAAVFIYRKIPQLPKMIWLKVALILICAGAIGNFIDRVVHAYVVDFIYFELINFPIFNVADIYVTGAAFFLVFLVLFVYKEDDLSFLSGSKNN